MNTIKMNTDDGPVTVSSGHKFLTTEGWKCVEDLKSGDYLQCVTKQNKIISICIISDNKSTNK